MGTWDVGPFDNDSAADWCFELNDTDPEQRATLIRSTLSLVAEQGDAYLDIDDGAAAIAAAAVVASRLPGGTPIDSPYAPDFITEGGAVEVAGDVPAIAVRALDRVVAEESEWRALWEESDSYPLALASVQAIRDVLAPPSGR